jgi:G3E family GTPase
LTTVDAVNGSSSLERHPEVTKQISVADLVLVTKTDLASTEMAKGLADRTAAINPVAEILDARSSAFAFDGLLRERSRTQRANRFAADEISAEEISAHSVHTFTLSIDEPLDWSTFVVWLSLLLTRHGERILRLKGILDTGESASPILVHGVQHIMHSPEHLAEWPVGLVIKKRASSRTNRIYALRPTFCSRLDENSTQTPL